MAVDVVLFDQYKVTEPDQDGHCVHFEGGEVWGTASYSYMKKLLETFGVSIPEVDIFEKPENGLIPLVEPQILAVAVSDALRILAESENPILNGKHLYEEDTWEGDEYVKRQHRQSVRVFSAMQNWSTNGNHVVVIP